MGSRLGRRRQRRMTNASSGLDTHLPEPASNVLRPHLSAPWGVRLGRNRRRRATKCLSSVADRYLHNDPEPASNVLHPDHSAPVGSSAGAEKAEGGNQLSLSRFQVEVYALAIIQKPQAINFNRIPSQPWGVWLGRNEQRRAQLGINPKPANDGPQS
jgi:hypothetical protein